MALSLSGEEEEYDSESEQVWASSLTADCLRCVRFAEGKTMGFLGSGTVFVFFRQGDCQVPGRSHSVFAKVKEKEKKHSR